MGNERTHDRVGSSPTTVGNLCLLHEDVLLEGISAAILNADLDLLDDQHDSGLLVALTSKAGLAEQVVQVAVEAILLVLYDEDLVDLLDDGLLDAVVDNLQVLLLQLEDLLLAVEVVEAVDEVEVVLATQDVQRVGRLTLCLVSRELRRSVDWLCGCAVLVLNPQVARQRTEPYQRNQSQEPM